MKQLPYDLLFCHRFNLHKGLGFNIDDNDFDSIARIYGVKTAEVEEAEEELQRRVKHAAEKIKKDHPALAAPEKADSMVYLALGDSITADRASYAKIIREIWGGQNVIDAGISGDTTADVVDRFYPSVLNNYYDTASVFIGTNDSRGLGDGNGITRVGIEDYAKKLRYFIAAMQNPPAGNGSEGAPGRQKKVLVITLPPARTEVIRSYFGEEANWVYTADHLQAMNKVIRDTAKETGAVLIDLAAEIESAGTDPIDNDGIHLNLDAQTLLAEMVLEELFSK
jgi:lysophospholipase L1-like esterase